MRHWASIDCSIGLLLKASPQVTSEEERAKHTKASAQQTCTWCNMQPSWLFHAQRQCGRRDMKYGGDDIGRHAKGIPALAACSHMQYVLFNCHKNDIGTSALQLGLPVYIASVKTDRMWKEAVFLQSFQRYCSWNDSLWHRLQYVGYTNKHFVKFQ